MTINTETQLITEDNIEQHLPEPLPRAGDVVTGTVIKVYEDRLIVDIKQKYEGIIYSREMRNIEEQNLPGVGDTINAYVIKAEDSKRRNGTIILSIDKAEDEQGWRKLEESMEANATVSGKVSDVNRGGLIVTVEGINGFIPLSHLVSPFREIFTKSENDLDEIREKAVGLDIEFKIIDFNKRRYRAIFSHRLAAQEVKQKRKLELMEELREGQTIKGTIVGLSDFGAFMDIGGTDALIHISEMSWEPIKSPADILKIGQECDAYVYRIDRDSEKISLSLKRLQPEPWERAREALVEGAIVDATITNLVTFGAFARLNMGVEGLIHLSEISHRQDQPPQRSPQRGPKATGDDLPHRTRTSSPRAQHQETHRPTDQHGHRRHRERAWPGYTATEKPADTETTPKHPSLRPLSRKQNRLLAPRKNLLLLLKMPPSLRPLSRKQNRLLAPRKNLLLLLKRRPSLKPLSRKQNRPLLRKLQPPRHPP